MNSLSRIILWLALAFACFLPASALTPTAPENHVWKIFSIGYDAPVAGATDLGNRTETSTSNYDTAPIHRAAIEKIPTEANRSLFGQNAEFKAAEDAGAGVLRVRHYTDNEGLAGIQNDSAINASRGGGVHVEVGPDFGPVSTAQAETGAARGEAYVEFDAPGNMVPTNVGPRSTAVIPSTTPVPISGLNPVYVPKPWWQFW